MANLPVVCLHTDDAGCVWSLTARGAIVKPRAIVNENSKPATYRVLGCKQNYSLIENLFTRLNWYSKQSRLFVGSPLIGKHADSVDAALRKLAVLGVHDNLPNRWHLMDSRGFHNYRTLSYFNAEGVSVWSKRLLREHCTAPFFEFLGLTRDDLALQLIADIGDPRWFIDANHPYRMAALENYCGLRPDSFLRVWEGNVDLAKGPSARAVNLMAIVANLPKDSFVFSELQTVAAGHTHCLFACRMVLGFIARNWLASVANPAYFEPEQFFGKPENRTRFMAGFRG